MGPKRKKIRTNLGNEKDEKEENNKKGKILKKIAVLGLLIKALGP